MSLYPSFARPRNLEQATELLASLNTGAVIIAGGQELMPSVNYGLMAPDMYIDIGAIDALKNIQQEQEELCIGALTVHRQLQKDPLIARVAPLLSYAATQVGGGLQVHNRGTIGGNIVSMHPLYDIAPSLLALNAEVEIISGEGVRRVSFAELLKETSHGLGSEALLTRIFIQPMAADMSWQYLKLKTSGGAYGAANCVVILSMSGDTISSLRVVIGAASEKLVDASDELHRCIGKTFSAEMATFIERTCAECIETPLSDHQGPAEWRRAMAGVVARRAVASALVKNKHQTVTLSGGEPV